MFNTMALETVYGPSSKITRASCEIIPDVWNGSLAQQQRETKPIKKSTLQSFVSPPAPHRQSPPTGVSMQYSLIILYIECWRQPPGYIYAQMSSLAVSLQMWYCCLSKSFPWFLSALFSLFWEEKKVGGLDTCNICCWVSALWYYSSSNL